MEENKKFWDNYSKIYDFEINRFSKKAYDEMYRLMGASLSKDMKVLEVATGTGLIALNIARFVKTVEATDYSEKMIEKAKKKKVPANVNFSIEDVKNLSFKDNSFDTCIISNALHIISEPETVLENIRRVLKPNGLLIAPTYTHGHISDKAWERNARFLKLFGMKSYAKRTPDEFEELIRSNGFHILNFRVLHAAFPLVYLEARKIQ